MEAGRFIQDRYEDEYIRRDFPENWVNQETGAWQGPEDLGAYWDALSTAERDEYGILRSRIPRPPTGWKGPTQNLIPTRGNFSSLSLSRPPAPGSLNTIYTADPYTVPHMQTGGAWEGLGAEYQPGTVEGLNLLAGDPYTGYQSMDQSLLGQAPSYAATPGSWGTNPFQLGLDGGTDTDTTDNTTNTGTDFMWHYTPGYGQHNTDWTWGSKSNVYTDPNK